MEFQVRLSGSSPLTRQIYDQMRAAILDGRLRRGTRLPSTRDLATQLNVARKTVVVAYDMLFAEGLVRARSGTATYVETVQSTKPRAPGNAIGPLKVGPLWQEVPALPTFPRGPVKFDFGIGVPDLTQFPWSLWRTLSARCLRAASEYDCSYLSPQGYGPTREAIAAFASFSRAVRATADDVLVTNGAQQAFQLIAQVMMQPGTVVAIESPGYGLARSLFRAHGTRIVDVPVDRYGLLVSRLPDDAKLVYTTPSHQFPTGVVMSFERRAQLLEWARARGAAIIEDDYDSEFRFEGRSLESLQSLDPSLVIYVGTFSKSMFPGVRLGFAIAPPSLQSALVAAKQLTDWNSSFVNQAALAAFIDEGYYLRHIKRARRLYLARRTRLIAEIDRTLSDWLEIQPSGTGLHFAARFLQLTDADAIAKSALARDVRIVAMPDGLIFGLGAIATERIPAGVAQLRSVLEEHFRSRPAPATKRTTSGRR